LCSGAQAAAVVVLDPGDGRRGLSVPAHCPPITWLPPWVMLVLLGLAFGALALAISVAPATVAPRSAWPSL